MTDPAKAIRDLRDRARVPQTLAPLEVDRIEHLLTIACRESPGAPAVTSLGHTLNFSELESYADAFAVYLQQHTSLVPGDRIAVQLPNISQYPIVLFAALRAGLIVVNVNPLYTDRELLHQFKDSGAKALVVVANVAQAVEDVLADTEIGHVIITEVADMHGFLQRKLINFAARRIKKMVPPYNIPNASGFRDCLAIGQGEKPVPVDVGCDDVALLQYTGGTTGLAKGAMLSHRNLLSNAAQTETMFKSFNNFEAGQKTIVQPLPMYHVYAFTATISMVAMKNHTVLIPNPRDLNSIVKTMDKYPPDCLFGLNTLFVALCHNKDFMSLDFSRLRITVSGGMALTADAARAWHEVTGCQVYEGYGLTETSPVVSINIARAIKLGSIGVALPSTDIRVVDDAGKPLACGEAGELQVRGPQVMLGYWQQPERTAEVLKDGWLSTGDIGIIDEDGFPRIVDRKKDMIIVSGFNVFPNEVEQVLSDHPGVLECAVIGVPDSRTGEKVKAIIVPESDSLSKKDVLDYCREQLAAYKVPHIIEFTTSLPKSNIGKILRRELREAAKGNH